MPINLPPIAERRPAPSPLGGPEDKNFKNYGSLRTSNTPALGPMDTKATTYSTVMDADPLTRPVVAVIVVVPFPMGRGEAA